MSHEEICCYRKVISMCQAIVKAGGKVLPSVIINRAVPGSGKTTLSSCVVDFLRSRGVSVTLHSTDEYFLTPERRYAFDIAKLHEYHFENVKHFVQDLEKGIDVVICDNINLSPWHTKPYTAAARKYGRFIFFLTFEPRELEKHVESQMVTPEKPDAHGVPEEVLIRFIEEYRTYDVLLDKNAVVLPEKHRNFIWDQENCVKKELQELCSPFDLDAFLRIYPHQYHDYKETLGEKVFNILQKGCL